MYIFFVTVPYCVARLEIGFRLCTFVIEKTLKRESKKLGLARASYSVCPIWDNKSFFQIELLKN